MKSPNTRRLKCPSCGVFFTRPTNSRAWDRARFCSALCRVESLKTIPTRTCKQCGATFRPPSSRSLQWEKFCSRECWRLWTAAHSRRRVTLKCATCGDTFERHAAWAKKNSGAVYCSRDCQAQGRVRGDSYHSRGKGWTKLAEQIRLRDRRLCVRCDEPEGVRKHAVDHIVPWRIVNGIEAIANDPANLATLCHSCHGIKTSRIEPRLLRGDWLALQQFYGKDRAEAAMAVVVLNAR